MKNAWAEEEHLGCFEPSTQQLSESSQKSATYAPAERVPCNSAGEQRTSIRARRLCNRRAHLCSWQQERTSAAVKVQP